ncbi:MAG TPA: hypothetical protein VN538_05520 [Clostridia bacterium]|nr:hypothetical protein [Clostridia bacterium]
MRKISVVFLTVLMMVALLSGCKTESSTILNTGSKIFYGGSQIETTVRELKVDGGTTTARVRFLNLGSEELASIEALVEFVDAKGETIASFVIQDTFETPVPVGESFSETAECDSNSKIKNVIVSEYVPQS